MGHRANEVLVTPSVDVHGHGTVGEAKVGKRVAVRILADPIARSQSTGTREPQDQGFPPSTRHGPSAPRRVRSRRYRAAPAIRIPSRQAPGCSPTSRARSWSGSCPCSRPRCARSTRPAGRTSIPGPRVASRVLTARPPPVRGPPRNTLDRLVPRDVRPVYRTVGDPHVPVRPSAVGKSDPDLRDLEPQGREIKRSGIRELGGGAIGKEDGHDHPVALGIGGRDEPRLLSCPRDDSTGFTLSRAGSSTPEVDEGPHPYAARKISATATARDLVLTSIRRCEARSCSLPVTAGP